MMDVWNEVKRYVPFMRHLAQERLVDEKKQSELKTLICYFDCENPKDLEAKGKLTKKGCDKLSKYIKSVYNTCKDRATLIKFKNMFKETVLSIEISDSDDSVQIVASDDDTENNEIVEAPKIIKKNYAKKSTSRSLFTRRNKKSERTEDNDDSSSTDDECEQSQIFERRDDDNIKKDVLQPIKLNSDCIIIDSDSDDDSNEANTSTNEKSVNPELQEKNLDELEKYRRECEIELFDLPEKTNLLNDTTESLPIPQQYNSNFLPTNVSRINPNDPRGKNRVELLYNKNVMTQIDQNQNTQISKISTIPLPPINQDEILNALNFKNSTVPPQPHKRTPSTYGEYLKIKAAAEAKKKAEFEARRKKEEEFEIRKSRVSIDVVKKISNSESKKKAELKARRKKGEELEIAKSRVSIDIIKKIPNSESCIDKEYRSGFWKPNSNLLSNTNKFKIPKKSSSIASTSSSVSINTKIQSNITPKSRAGDTFKKSLIKKRHSISERRNSNLVSSTTVDAENSKKFKCSSDSDSDSDATIKIRGHVKKRINSNNSINDSKSANPLLHNYNGDQIENNSSKTHTENSNLVTTSTANNNLSDTDSDVIKVRRRVKQRINSSESEPDNKSNDFDAENFIKNLDSDNKKDLFKQLIPLNDKTCEKILKIINSQKVIPKNKPSTTNTITKSKPKKNEVQRLIEDFDNSYLGKQSSSTDYRRSRLSKKRTQSDEETPLIEKETKKRKLIQRHKSCYMERINIFNDEEPLQPEPNDEDYETDEFPGYQKLKNMNKENSEYIIPKLPIKEVVISLERLTDRQIVKFTKRRLSASIALPTIKAKEVSKLGRRRLSRKISSQLNTNNSHHCENKDIIKYCLLCGKASEDMINHYVNVHNDMEVFISRLSKETIDLYKRDLNYGYLIDKSTKKYKVYCIFCQNSCIYTLSGFYEHYASHTGEFAYQCQISECEIKYAYEKEIRAHCKLKHKRTQSYNQLYSYNKELTIKISICNICNYVQLNTANIIRHLKTQHFITTNFESHLNDLIVVELFESNERVQIQNEKIFEENVSKEHESSSDIDIGGVDDEFVESMVKLENDEYSNSTINTNDSEQKQFITEIGYSKLLGIDKQQIDEKPTLFELNEIFDRLEKNLNDNNKNNNNNIELQMQTSDESTISNSIQPAINNSEIEETNQTIDNDILNNVFYNKSKYVSHRERFKCTEKNCKFSGENENSIEDHFGKIHRRYAAYKCLFCEVEIKDEVKDFKIIKNHLRMHSKTIYACCKCKFVDHNRHIVSEHVRKNHKIEMNITKLTRTLNSNNILNIKFSTLLEDGIRELNMDYCLICFNNIIKTDNINKHLYDKHKCKITYQCCYCENLYFTQDEITDHISGEHKRVVKIRCLYEININLNEKNNKKQTDNKIDNIKEITLPIISNVSSLAITSLKDLVNYNDETDIVKSNESTNITSNQPTTSTDENIKRKFQSNSSNLNANKKKNLISCKKLKLNYNVDSPSPKKAQEINVIPNTNNQVDTFELHKCDECGYQSKSIENIREHESLDHNFLNSSAGYCCDQCDFLCEMKNDLIEHKKAKHNFKPFKCNDCDLQFFNLRQHQIHIMATHLQSSGFFCVECKRFYETQSDLFKHQINTYGKDYLKNNHFECKKCKKYFHGQSELKEHENSEHFLYYCKECTFTCHSKLYLKRHVCHSKIYLKAHEKSVNITNKENTSQPQCSTQQSSKVQEPVQSVFNAVDTLEQSTDQLPVESLVQTSLVESVKQSSVQSSIQSTIHEQPSKSSQLSVTLSVQQTTTSLTQSTVNQLVQSSYQPLVATSVIQETTQYPVNSYVNPIMQTKTTVPEQSAILPAELLVQSSVQSMQSISQQVIQSSVQSSTELAEFLQPEPVHLSVQPQIHVPIATTPNIGTLRLVPIEKLVNPNLLNINDSPIRNILKSVNNIVSQQFNQLSNQNQPFNQGILPTNFPSTSITSNQLPNYMNQSLDMSRVMLPEFNFKFKNDLIYICQYCNYEIHDIKILLDHWRTKHNIENDNSFQYSVQRLVRCGYCKMRGTFSTIKQHHLQTHMPQTFFIRRNSILPMFECVECSFSSNLLAPFYNHLTTIHLNLIRQNELKQNIVTEELLNELLKIGYRKLEYTCTICKKVFLEKDIFEKHIIYNHNITQINYSINWQKSNYYSCKECSVIYLTMFDSLIHIREQHTKQYQCVICKESVANNELIHHNNIHNLYNNYQYKNTSVIDDYHIYIKKINIIFPNGLVLNLLDLENTIYGNKADIFQLLLKIQNTETNNNKR